MDLDVVVNQIEQRVDHVQECWAQCQDEVVRRWAPPHQFPILGVFGPAIVVGEYARLGARLNLDLGDV